MELYSILLVDFSPTSYLLFTTQAPILVWFDGTIIDIISDIFLTMYYSVYAVMIGGSAWGLII